MESRHFFVDSYRTQPTMDRTELIFDLPDETEFMNQVFRAARDSKNNVISLDEGLNRKAPSGSLILMKTVYLDNISRAIEVEERIKKIRDSRNPSRVIVAEVSPQYL